MSKMTPFPVCITGWTTHAALGNLPAVPTLCILIPPCFPHIQSKTLRGIDRGPGATRVRVQPRFEHNYHWWAWNTGNQCEPQGFRCSSGTRCASRTTIFRDC